MKKILLFAALALVAFGSTNCSGDLENTNVNRITFVVDGFTKIINYVTITSTDPSVVSIYGQVNGSTVETIRINVYKEATGTGAIQEIVFTQDNVEYYSSIGNNVSTNVTANGADHKIKGTFQGNFKSLSNSGKVIDNGSFKITY
ncbi:hypothetical protein [Flavobacterium sp. 3HN19-14]|uniref:hypothetical protein n=1 Tax=Flavobacterium sp. 3HN19-14 TaxID=3448133 RepID=UPI003EE18615